MNYSIEGDARTTKERMTLKGEKFCPAPYHLADIFNGGPCRVCLLPNTKEIERLEDLENHRG